MDGTRAGRFASSGDAGRLGGLCTPGAATLESFALTRTLTLGDGEGVFSSGCDDSASAECAGEVAALTDSAREEVDRRLEDALPLRCLGKDCD